MWRLGSSKVPALLILGALALVLIYYGTQGAAASSASPAPWDTTSTQTGPVYMTTSDFGLQRIRNFEGLRLQAYQDPGGVWTIGYGHTGSDVSQGLVITRADADALLRADLATAEATVNSSVSVSLTQGQFDALVSFVYNVGGGAFQTSTLLAKLNAGDYASAAAEFGNWNQDANGQPLAGLMSRRSAEAALFRTSTV
jgi:lysozyme